MQTIQSHDVEDRDIRELSWILAPTRSWENVVDLGHNSAVISNRPVFVFVDTFRLAIVAGAVLKESASDSYGKFADTSVLARKYCVDWLVVVEMPRESILEGIISHRTTTLVASISAPLAMFIFLIVMLAFGIFARRILKRSKVRGAIGCAWR